MKQTAESVTAGLDLTGKTAIVTGATSGLGREAARVLALRGARVVAPCRDATKGQRVAAEIAASLPDGARGSVDPRACDLTSMAAVRRLVSSLAEEHTTVDIVLLNAGVFNLPFQLTDEGLERTFAANFAGHFVLFHAMLDQRVLSPDARVAATLSEAVRLNPFLRVDLEMLTNPRAHERRFSRHRASPDSKVLTTLALQHFSRVTAGTPFERVSFDGCDPGPTLTDNVNQGGPVLNALARVAGALVMKPVERGAAVLVWAVTHPAASGGSARLFTNELRDVGIPKRWRDAEVAERVWREAEERLGVERWPGG